MSNLFYPFVLVVTPVLIDFERLKTCLKALVEQTHSKKLYEVIVVDKGSIDPLVIQYQSSICYPREPSWLYTARNKGIFPYPYKM